MKSQCRVFVLVLIITDVPSTILILASFLAESIKMTMFEPTVGTACEHSLWCVFHQQPVLWFRGELLLLLKTEPPRLYFAHCYKQPLLFICSNRMATEQRQESQYRHRNHHRLANTPSDDRRGWNWNFWSNQIAEVSFQFDSGQLKRTGV